jgi:hypothetical protein
MVDIVAVQVKLICKSASMSGRHAVVHFQPHHRGKAALAQLLVDHVEQIVGLFLVAREVGVARDAEGIDGQRPPCP